MWGAAEPRPAGKISGKSGKSGKSGRSFHKFDRGEIIGWDGEGINTGQIDEKTVGSDMILFANSLGQAIGDESRRRLRTKECLDFIMETGKEHPNALHFIYGGSWDVTHILRDVPSDKMRKLLPASNKMTHQKISYGGYVIDYVPRRLFHIMQYGSVLNKKTGVIDRKVINSVQIWDVVGFFQLPFVKALDGWLGTEYANRDLIIQGKALRDQFDRQPWQFIFDYNMAELELLVQLMDVFRSAVMAIDLRINRWDGAGALATAMFQKYEVKQHIPNDADYPEALKVAIRHAYFGARIEAAMLGVHFGAVYGADINSAYPFAMTRLPSQTNGEWRHIVNPDLAMLPEFSIVHLAWDFSRARYRFNPFPYRGTTGRISYPMIGRNWVWLPEIDAYLNTIRDERDSLIAFEAYAFFPNDATEFPFAPVVNEYYRFRREITLGEHSDIPFACEKPIKLGINSMYGKLAQNTGYNPETGRIPPFHNLAYAGFITSYTRANVYRAAMQKPESVIAIATDGIFTTEPLDLPYSTVKELGKWERSTHDGIIMIQSGFYFFYDEGKGYTIRSRGVDRPESQEEVNDLVQRVRETFALNDYQCGRYVPLEVKQTRFVTPRASLAGKDWKRRYAGWYHVIKQIDMHFASSHKRQWDRKSNGQPALGLCQSYAALDPFLYAAVQMKRPPEQIKLSQPYVLPWDFPEEFYDELEQQGLESMEGNYYER